MFWLFLLAWQGSPSAAEPCGSDDCQIAWKAGAGLRLDMYCLVMYINFQLDYSLLANYPPGEGTGVVWNPGKDMYGFVYVLNTGLVNTGSVFTGIQDMLRCTIAQLEDAVDQAAGLFPLSDPVYWRSLVDRVARGEIAWDEVVAMLPPVAQPPV